MGYPNFISKVTQIVYSILQWENYIVFGQEDD